MKLIYTIKHFEGYAFDENKVLWKLPYRTGNRNIGIRRVSKQDIHGNAAYWLNRGKGQELVYLSKIRKLLKPCSIEIDIIKETEPF